MAKRDKQIGKTNPVCPCYQSAPPAMRVDGPRWLQGKDINTSACVMYVPAPVPPWVLLWDPTLSDPCQWSYFIPLPINFEVELWSTKPSVDDKRVWNLRLTYNPAAAPSGVFWEGFKFSKCGNGLYQCTDGCGNPQQWRITPILH